MGIRSITIGPLITATVLATGCFNPVGPDGHVRTGTWASAEAAVTVNTTGAHLEFPCASGDISQPLVANDKREFTVNGVYVRAAGPGLISQPARYSGRIDKDTMTLTVTISETNQTIGPVSVTFGGQPSFAKCL